MLKRLLSQSGASLMLAAVALGSPPQPMWAQATQATICKDGTTSAASGRGACSGHGGVDKKATTAARTPASSATVAARVTCSDGTTSKSGRGACSRHGGIAGSMSTPNTTVVPPRSPEPSRVSPAPATLPAPVPQQAPARTRNEANTKTTSPVGSGAREDNNPVGAIAQCKDGLYSHAKHRRGACSRHGGVAQWISA